MVHMRRQGSVLRSRKTKLAACKYASAPRICLMTLDASAWPQVSMLASGSFDACMPTTDTYTQTHTRVCTPSCRQPNERSCNPLYTKACHGMKQVPWNVQGSILRSLLVQPPDLFLAVCRANILPVSKSPAGFSAGAVLISTCSAERGRARRRGGVRRQGSEERQVGRGERGAQGQTGLGELCLLAERLEQSATWLAGRLGSIPLKYDARSCH